MMTTVEGAGVASASERALHAELLGLITDWEIGKAEACDDEARAVWTECIDSLKQALAQHDVDLNPGDTAVRKMLGLNDEERRD
jgi:hypothetical protein